MTETKEAFFEKRIDFYTKALFLCDFGNFYIDIKSEKNIEFTTKKMLEREVEAEILKKKSASESSLRYKIAWYLSPNTRHTAKSSSADDKFIGYILHKKGKNPRTKIINRTKS